MECYKQKRDEISTYSLRYKSKVACKLRLSIILLYFHDSLYIILIYQSVADSLLRNYSITLVKLEVTGRWIIFAPKDIAVFDRCQAYLFRLEKEPHGL